MSHKNIPHSFLKVLNERYNWNMPNLFIRPMSYFESLKSIKLNKPSNTHLLKTRYFRCNSVFCSWKTHTPPLYFFLNTEGGRVVS